MALRDLFFRKPVAPVPPVIPHGATARLRITGAAPDGLLAEAT